MVYNPAVAVCILCKWSSKAVEEGGSEFSARVDLLKCISSCASEEDSVSLEYDTVKRNAKSLLCVCQTLSIRKKAACGLK